MKWFNRAKKETFTTYQGIARITQINDTIIELDSEIKNLSDDNTEICYATREHRSYLSSNTLLDKRNRSDTSSYLTVQTKSRLVILEVLKQHKLDLEAEAKTVMSKCVKD